MIIKGCTQTEFIRWFDSKDRHGYYTSPRVAQDTNRYITNGRILFESNCLTKLSRQEAIDRIIEHAAKNKKIARDVLDRILSAVVDSEETIKFNFIMGIMVNHNETLKDNEVFVFSNEKARALCYVSSNTIKSALFILGAKSTYDLSNVEIIGKPGRKHPKKILGPDSYVIISEYGKVVEDKISEAIPKLYLYSDYTIHPTMKSTLEAVKIMYTYVDRSFSDEDPKMSIELIQEAMEIIDRSLLLRDSYIHEKEQRLAKREYRQLSLIDAFK